MWRFFIDTGGTFTDCLALTPEGKERRIKVLSNAALRGTVSAIYEASRIRIDGLPQTKDGFFEGYTLRIGGETESISTITASAVDDDTFELEDAIDGIEAGALCSIQSPEEPPTLAMRLLSLKRLDEALPPLDLRLATTRGTNALLEGKGARIAFFVTKGFKDLLRIGNQQRPDLFELGIRKREPLHHTVFEVPERLSAEGCVVELLDEEAVREAAETCRRSGIESVAVALLHSYLNPEIERRVAAILKEAGLNRISLSSELASSIKILPRAETAVVDAYLAPIMNAYLDSVEASLPEPSLKVMTSAGGLATRSSFRPKDSLLSGPAGGVVGSSSVGKQVGRARSIAFDMGGTSTDVSRFDERLDYRFEQSIGGARVFAPSLRIETVAAGGGSICWFDGTAMRVGPESAGASPGPACYGAGGPLTVTDVNLLLGRLDASRFGIPVFPEAAAARSRELAASIERVEGRAVDERSLWLGLLAIANERMADAIRGISLRQGYDPSEYALIAFGGAGGLHACSIANILGMDTIVFPSDAGLLSAYGLQQARMEAFERRSILKPFLECVDTLEPIHRELERKAIESLVDQGEEAHSIITQSIQVEMRFAGQEASLLVDFCDPSDLESRFCARFESQYGFLPKQAIEVVSLTVSVTTVESELGEERFAEKRRLDAGDRLFWDREALRPGDSIAGPAVVQDRFSTVFVETGWIGIVGDQGNLRLERSSIERDMTEDDSLETVELELFTNRFLSLVEEMGSLLERSAFSTNVKERRDFSCALLDTDGYLVANAPHIPVHLGALGVCVRSIRDRLDLQRGDVIVTNHPGYGGSHLPDVTLVAPVYSDEGDLIGYVANRAHHAEIGGIAPGSMPPDAKSLEEEGVVIEPTYLARGGKVDWKLVTGILTDARYPTRRLEENLSDLAAQLASIRFGDSELRSLSRREGVDTVARYIAGLKRRSAKALEDALEELSFDTREAEEYLDDGAKIAVRVSRGDSKWLVDFEGSAMTQPNNYNATPAIATSATIYSLRLLANAPIPLNEGFLDVVDIRIPKGMLNPRFGPDARACPPVVAGNVEVSQRIVDTLIKAFGVAACSQGTMNNLIFGNERVSYYETIAGGEGATADRNGADAVHTHMTNTAITDPEIFERRFPVRLERFEIREGSGGRGKNRGGDGACRRIRFLEPVTVSCLMQHRESAPFGLKGGESGQAGRQSKISQRGDRLALPGSGSTIFNAEEAIEILTPGGGGFGQENSPS